MDSEQKIICVSSNNNVSLVVCVDKVYAFLSREAFSKKHEITKLNNKKINHATSAHGYQIVASLNNDNPENDCIYQIEDNFSLTNIILEEESRVISITCSSATTYYQLGNFTKFSFNFLFNFINFHFIFILFIIYFLFFCLFFCLFFINI
jgi:hypothetical protein